MCIISTQCRLPFFHINVMSITYHGMYIISALLESDKHLPTVHGERYLWNLPILTVEQGDEVDWSWEPPEYISGVSYRVEQTANATASAYDGSGFRSGKTNTPKGGYLGCHPNTCTYAIIPAGGYLGYNPNKCMFSYHSNMRVLEQPGDVVTFLIFVEMWGVSY